MSGQQLAEGSIVPKKKGVARQLEHGLQWARGDRPETFRLIHRNGSSKE